MNGKLPPRVPEPGQPGTRGEPGLPTGRGGRGGRGAKGTPGAGWSDKSMMFLVALLTAVFAFLFARVAVNQNQIAAERFESCMGGQRIIEQYNAQQTELARVLRANPELPGGAELAAVYDAGRLPVPYCPERGE